MLSFIFLIVIIGLAYVLITKKPLDPLDLRIPTCLHHACIVAILALNVFAYDVDHGLGGGFFLCSIVGALVLAKEKKKRTPVFMLIAGLGSITSLLFAFRANDFVQELNVLFVLLCIASLLFLRSVDTPRFTGLWLIQGVWQYMVRVVRQIPVIISHIIHIRTVKHPLLLRFIKTALITIVAVLFFASILSKADPIFANLIDEFIDQLFARTILSVLLIVLLCLLTTFDLVVHERKAKDEWLGFYELSVPVGSVLLLFVAFIVIQIQYLFGSHADFRLLEMTYSEYVRQGFQELLFATFFGGLLSYIVTLKQDSYEAVYQRSIVKILNILLLAALFFVLASALKRDVMYVEMYGLTRIRVVGTIFLAWLALSLGMLSLFSMLKKWNEQYVLIGISITGFVALFVVNTVNMDGFIAKAQPPRNQPKDFVYINALSEDAIQGWHESAQEALRFYENTRVKNSITKEEKVRLADMKIAMQLLAYKRDELSELHSSENWKWQNYNSSKFLAYLHMTQNRKLFFDAVDCINNEMDDLQITKNIDLYELEYSRLYEYKYPFVDMPYTWWYYPTSLETMKENRTYEGMSLTSKPVSCKV